MTLCEFRRLLQTERPDSVVHYTFDVAHCKTIFSSTVRDLLAKLRSRDPYEWVSVVTARRLDAPDDPGQRGPDDEWPLWIIGNVIQARVT